MVTRELVEEANIELAKLGAGETSDDRADNLVDKSSNEAEVENTEVEEVGNGLLEQLEGEAGKVVALEQVLGVQNTTGDVRHIQTDEGVDLADVTTELEGVGVGSVTNANVESDIHDGVLVAGRAAVPLLGDALLATLPLEGAGLTADTEEGLEVVSVKVSAGLLGTVVAHEVDDEVVGGGHDNDGGEGTSEVVRVVGDRLLLDLTIVLAELVTVSMLAIVGTSEFGATYRV